MKTKKLALIPLVLMISAILATLPKPVYAAPADTKIKVIPKDNIFYTDTTPLGSTFIVNMTVFNVTNLYTWQIKLFFNSTAIECTNATYPSDHVFAGKPIVPVIPIIDNVTGNVMHGCSLMGAVAPFSGSGTLCQIGFKIKASPPVGGSITSYLNFSTPYGADTFLLNYDMDTIPTDMENGNCAYKWRGALPTLKVEPEQYIAPVSHVNETFKVDITISKLNASSKMIGVEFKLGYDTTLLKVVDVREGSFMNDSRWHNAESAPYTFFINFVEYDYVIIGILLVPNSTGSWNYFPYGSGTLATITFKEIYQPIVPQPSASCDLTLYDSMLVDEDLNEIPNVVENGYYEVTPLELPTLQVTPATWTGTHRGEEFSVNININNLDARWGLIGPEFKLRYNTAMLKVVDVREGLFMNDSRWHNAESAPYTFFINFVEYDYVIIGILLVPNATGNWNTFPYGSGTLATITFRIIQGPSASCDLTLFDILLVNSDLYEINYTGPQSGFYSMTREKLTHQVVWNAQTFYVVTESDITINSGYPVKPPVFNQEHRRLYFNVTVPVETGFCNVTIPKALLTAVPSSNWVVLVDGWPTPFIMTENGTHTFLYFNVTSGVQNVNIIGTEAVTEFSVASIIAIFLIATLVVAVSVRAMKSRKRRGTNVVRNW